MRFRTNHYGSVTEILPQDREAKDFFGRGGQLPHQAPLYPPVQIEGTCPLAKPWDASVEGPYISPEYPDDRLASFIVWTFLTSPLWIIMLWTICKTW